MIMDFTQAWDTIEIGDEVTVSDGTPQPSANTSGLPYLCWKSHNFTGTLAAKNDGPPRSLLINQAADEAGSVVGYSVQEGIAHTFDQGEP